MAYRQDATNSKLKQTHMELECGLLASSNFKPHEPLLGAETLCTVSDVIPVEGGSGVATVGMSLKMLDSVGCITWRELSKRFSDMKARVAQQRGLLVDETDGCAGEGQGGGSGAMAHKFRQDVSKEPLVSILTLPKLKLLELILRSSFDNPNNNNNTCS